MVEEGYQPKRNHHSSHVKAVVYLGGKSLFRKFLLELKQAFSRYDVQLDCDELKYEGETRGRQKWGRGMALFRSGMVYEGEFRENMRCGRGCLSLNGISIYEGEWVGNQLHGEGYLKSMRLMTASCPELFQ